jgi:hypothetical protein
MRKVLILALMTMFFAAMACNRGEQGTAASPEASPSEAASPAAEASPAGGMASPAGGEASPAASPS